MAIMLNGNMPINFFETEKLFMLIMLNGNMEIRPWLFGTGPPPIYN